jgi:hypothetical protein
MLRRCPTRMAVVFCLGLSWACTSPSAPANEPEAPATGGRSGSSSGSGQGSGGASGSGGAAAGGTGGAPSPGQNSSPGADATTPTGTGGSMAAADAGGQEVAPPSSMPMTPPTSGDDPGPDRPLNVDVTNPQVFTFKFKPSEADPASSRRDETQTAIVDTRAKPHRGKLVVTLSGVNNPPGPVGVAAFAAGLGFHAFSIAYENSNNPSTQNDPKFFGDMRFEQFDGMDRVGAINVPRADCVEVRLAKSLAYLQTKNPQGDWAYFLDKKGEVRWSDVIFMGHSHGASSAAAFAKIRRVWRAISLSGPRDTRPVVATWLSMPSATPIDRYFAFTGTGDAQHDDHIKAMEAANYVGQLTDVAGGMPLYGGSHRLKYAGGHGDSANCEKYRDVCKYMLGVE